MRSTRRCRYSLSIISEEVSLSWYWMGPSHLRSSHLLSNSSWSKAKSNDYARVSIPTTAVKQDLVCHRTANSQYALVKLVGEKVQGPSKPERSGWHRPRAWAPDSATISWSLKPMR